MNLVGILGKHYSICNIRLQHSLTNDVSTCDSIFEFTFCGAYHEPNTRSVLVLYRSKENMCNKGSFWGMYQFCNHKLMNSEILSFDHFQTSDWGKPLVDLYYRFLKNLFGKIKFNELDFQIIWNWIFTASVAYKNHVRNSRQKIKRR